MANILIYDTETNIAKQYLKSVNTPDFTSRNDVLINPIMPNVVLKYIKVSDGKADRKSVV